MPIWKQQGSICPIKKDKVGSVLAIGFPQSEAEHSAEEHDYDIFCMRKDSTGYFLGLARLSDKDGLEEKLRMEEYEREKGYGANKYCRFRISGGVENCHAEFVLALAEAYRTLIKANRELGIPIPHTEGIYDERVTLAGRYLKNKGNFSLVLAEDYHSDWIFPRADTPIPERERKVGIWFRRSGENALTQTQCTAFDQLWEGMRTECFERECKYRFENKRPGLILDWEKISVDQPITAEDNIRGANLHEFAQLTHYRDGAIIDRPLSKVFPKGKEVQQPNLEL